MRVPHVLIVAGVLAATAGCSNNEGLRVVQKPGSGPDEFLIEPTKPLTQPTSYNVLPPPTPGGANLTDQNPKADAVAALGGNAASLSSSAVPGSDAALVTSASRYGVEPNVRADLAAEDADFRRRRGRLTQIRLFSTDRYAQVYGKDALDAFEENERYRRAGAATPTAPPLE